MKKNSFILFLFLSISIYSQPEESVSILLKGFKIFPNEVFEDRYGDLSHKKRNTIITRHTEKMAEDIDLIKFNEFYGDIEAYYELKSFSQNNIEMIGYSVKFSTFSTTEPGNIYFFKYFENELIDISSDILETFNFFTDNFKAETIDSLNSFYNKDMRKKPVHGRLIFEFSKSDTVAITYDFFDYYYMRNENPPGLDAESPHFDGQFYTKKYIMDNGKLRLAE